MFDFMDVHEDPLIIPGDVAVDDRGTLRFVNGFTFEGVKRFYQVQNHRRGFIRAWHGHMKEGKYIYVAKGSALLGAAKLLKDDDGDVHRHRLSTRETMQIVLSDKNPKVLWIPPGYANGAMTLEEDTIIMYFSTATIEETKDDDIRFPYDTWNIWQEDYR